METLKNIRSQLVNTEQDTTEGQEIQDDMSECIEDVLVFAKDRLLGNGTVIGTIGGLILVASALIGEAEKDDENKTVRSEMVEILKEEMLLQ